MARARNNRVKHAEINALSVEKRAYIAGLLDADGTVTCTIRNGRPTPMVLVVNCDLRLIEWLKATIGAGVAYRTKSKARRPGQDEANWRPVHRYQLTGRKAQSLLEMVRKFMIVKQARAELVFQLPVRGRDFGLTCPTAMRARSTELAAQIRSMNRRGVVHEILPP